MDEKHRQHCWECRRRSVVCDFSQPACERCCKSGIVCPGYSDRKPLRLRWLAPGRVLSKRRRLQGTAYEGSETTRVDQSTGATEELSRRMAEKTIPRFEGRTEVCALVQAAEYYNTCIYQDLIPISDLGPNPHVYLISPTQVHHATALPDHLRLSMVCMTLGHRINRMANVPHSNVLLENFYHYRGIAIRSLNQALDSGSEQTSDMVIAGIMTLLLVDTQQAALPSWRHHLDGIQKIIGLRGGIHELVGSTRLQSLLLCFLFVAVIGNTTSPASDITMAYSHLAELDIILQQSGDSVFSFQLCPPSLFAEIIKINHLRAQATGLDTIKTDLSPETYDILSRIESFSPEQWAETKPLSKGDWLIIGSVYKSAVALYCISSLQSVSVLPATRALRACCTTLGQRLHGLLKQALSSTCIQSSVLWPLILLGTEAVYQESTMRTFVAEKLQEMSRRLGSYLPLTAKAVLERFWASGETHWDACFDRSYVFTTQLAVDLSQLLHTRE